VHAAQTDNAEVTEHLEQGLRSEVKALGLIVFNGSTAVIITNG
jgi:hypothetical protein